MREGPETRTIKIDVCNGCEFVDKPHGYVGLTTCIHPTMMDHMCNIIHNHEDLNLTPEWCPLKGNNDGLACI